MNSNIRDICPESDCGNFPTPAPVAELPKEAEGNAKELVEKFYEALLVDGSLNEKRVCWGYAKQCALISINREIEVINRLLATNLNNDFDLLREREELMEVRTAINQL